MKKPKVSIIVINYNTQEFTINCLSSVLKNTKDINYEIIVIDNGSKEKFTIANFPFSNIKLIRNKKNLGFAKANNQGIKASKGEYILLLNSDTIVYNNVVGEMARWMDKNKKVGVATCALKNEDGSIQGTGGYFPTLSRVISWMTIEDIPFVDKIIKPFHPQHSKSVFKNNEFYTSSREIDWVTGAFLFTRKSVIDEVGMIDEDYFMYTEDTDFCYRVKKAGWKIMYLPKWSIIHLGGKSSTREFPILSEFKSVKLFYKKHYPSWQLPLVRFFMKVGALWRIPFFGLLYGKEAANTYAKAFRES